MTVERILTLATPRPTPYVRLYSFTDWEANSPTDPVPGTQLDAEFNAVKLSMTDTQNRLAQIQRDDGALANDSVGTDQVDPNLMALIAGGWNPRGVWTAYATYAVKDAVSNDGMLWVATTNHTATGSFAHELALGYWLCVMQPVAASSIPVAAIPGIAALNVQGVLANLAARVTALENAP